VKTNIIKNYLDKFPNLATMTLAKKIYNENSLQFPTLEAVRTSIRRLRGTTGKKKLKELITDKYLTQKKREEKYNLPESIEQEYKPYKIIGNKGLIFADVHIPFQDNDALSQMFDYTIKSQPDFILINGDLLDCYSLSFYCKVPDLTRFSEDIEKTKEFFNILKKIYPKAKIYFKKGNHEKWFEQYLKIKAPELWGINEFRLEILL
jgi:hypothetical protein